MPTPSQTRNMRKWTGVYFGPTRGRNVPHNSRRACLCEKEDTYSTECCRGALVSQGVGQTSYPFTGLAPFSDGFSNGFQINPI